MFDTNLLDWSEREALLFEKQTFMSRHRLHRLDAFQDEAIVELLDRYPRNLLQSFSSGSDAARFREDWLPVDIGETSGRDIWAALKTGSLWVNLRNITTVDESIGKAVEKLYTELAHRKSGFEPRWISASLFISSPGSMVYYHADPKPNILWHIRGGKRIWIYPAQDERFVPQVAMEDIFAGQVDEIPYDQEFDNSALVYDLQPGNAACWPQNAPHRISVLKDVNISLTTMHSTSASERRELVYLANRYFHRALKMPTPSTRESGLLSEIKRIGYRAARRLGAVPENIAPINEEYADRGRVPKALRIDLSAPGGVRLL